MSAELMRAEFEAWAKAEGMPLYRYTDGEYVSPTCYYWNGWCASASRRTVEAQAADVGAAVPAALTDELIDTMWADVLSTNPLPKPAYRALAYSVEQHLRAAGQGKDSERLDFVILARTSWYPARGKDGKGILCYESNGERYSSKGHTMRAAIDAAMKAGAHGGGNG